MSETFKVGQKVRVNEVVDGEITYGPFPSTYGTYTGYVVRIGDTEKLQRESDLTAIPEPPKFTVGDKARGVYSGIVYTIEAGPFDDAGYVWYATREPSGAVGHNAEDDLKVVEAEPVKVGDRVRILRATHAEHCHGRTGVVTSTSNDWRTWRDDTHPYIVRLEDGGTLHVAELERIDSPPADTYEYDGVTYDLTARYVDRDGDYWTFKRWDDGEVRGECAGTNRDVSGSISEYSGTLAEAVRNYGPLTRV